LSDIHEHSEDDGDNDLLSDLDEMINNIPSDEEPDPNMSPAPIQQSTPYPRKTPTNNNKTVAREIFNVDETNPIQTDDTSPVRGLKSAQKDPGITKTPAKTVDFKENVPLSPLLQLVI
jgi:hypothetical protein